MNRPAVLRQLETRVSQRAVIPYRVRASDVAKLVDYVRHLEGRAKVRPERVGAALDADEAMLARDVCPVCDQGLDAHHDAAGVFVSCETQRDVIGGAPEASPVLTSAEVIRRGKEAAGAIGVNKRFA